MHFTNCVLGYSMYTIRQNSRAEVQGNRYELGDFIIKIGTCIIGPGNTFRGILIEVISNSSLSCYINSLL